jgi:predicted site-specific integrase-resolvase
MNRNLTAFTGSTELYVTAEELGARLRVHRDTIAGWTKKYPDLPHITLPNGSLRFRPSEVEAWLKKFQKGGVA